MNNVLNIGLDLGSDTLKMAFAFENFDGDISYGKFTNKSKLTQIAIPAAAYYDVENKKWYFGDQIGNQSQSFITVVKIKSLISLLTQRKDETVWQENKKYYFYGHEFPKFYFPVSRKMLDNFDEMVADGRTFCAEDWTPQSVCVEFFKYVHSVVEERCLELNESHGTLFDTFQVAIVHPSSVGDEYLQELSSIVKKTFGKEAYKILSSTRALSMYAFHRGTVKNDDNFLVFDMGEEDISVTRAGFIQNQIIVDGIEGHNEPLEIGGIDVDKAIVADIDGAIANRETIGSPSSGEAGHLSEGAVYGKQYLLMKDIKKAKVIFSKPLSEDSVFKDGVPVTLSRDLYIQRVLTKEDVKKSIGVTDGTGVAEKIVKYILSEIERPVNHDVKKIFISGGLTETYSLLDYIKQEVKSQAPQVEVCTFDDNCESGDSFSVLSYEDSVFAPAIGGAIVALKNIVIKTILSFSYATWAYVDGSKCLSIFVDRGTPIDGGKDFVGRYNVGGAGTKEEELFSTHITRADIEKNKASGKWQYTTPGGGLLVGDQGSAIRKRAVKDFDLKTVSGGKKGKIYFKYRSREVTVSGGKIEFEEGISVDKRGKATPIIRNVSPISRMVTVTYKDQVSEPQRVSASYIEVIFEGLNGFKTIESLD